MNILKKAFLFFILSAALQTYAQNFPEIQKLESKNILFSQYQNDVLEANIQAAKGLLVQPVIYSYTAKKEDTVLTVSARCSITYDTLVTLNGIAENGEYLEGKQILLPSAVGLFIAEKPENTIEMLLSKEYLSLTESGKYSLYKINGSSFYFIQGARFSPSSRAFFLDSTMRLPIENSVLSSPFGMRVSPISGNWKFHNGIDMAAPEGTSVFACKSGKVTNTGKNDTYGNFITITHSNGMKSFYAHLSRILVEKGELVAGGVLIGKVGQTGLATGPHLHFEIIVNGSNEDPEKFF